MGLSFLMIIIVLIVIMAFGLLSGLVKKSK